MRNVLACGLAAALVVWMLTGCSGGGNGRNDAQTVSSTDRFANMEFTLTSRAVYRRGETITLAFTVKNIGQQRLDFLAGPPDSDASVRRGDSEVWRWSAGKAFPAVIREYFLQPGETKSYVLEWDQKDAQGNPVPAGTYTANAWFTAYPKNIVFVQPGEPQKDLDAGPITLTIQ